MQRKRSRPKYFSRTCSNRMKISPSMAKRIVVCLNFDFNSLLNWTNKGLKINLIRPIKMSKTSRRHIKISTSIIKTKVVSELRFQTLFIKKFILYELLKLEIIFYLSRMCHSTRNDFERSFFRSRMRSEVRNRIEVKYISKAYFMNKRLKNFNGLLIWSN